MSKHFLFSLSLIATTLVASDDPNSKTITCVVSGDKLNISELVSTKILKIVLPKSPD